ncbi:hypothetical protein CYY_000925 [Polysphondylium violaceum]|uniref:Uncharacterized protein n=1 Tax=Polysphondylium violaceum TaxID=133409 RepID=A0A8J4VB37_9MYCE|nr:hypothetical protein CYY_000925 [Polysphondylium violaceum]
MNGQSDSSKMETTGTSSSSSASTTATTTTKPIKKTSLGLSSKSSSDSSVKKISSSTSTSSSSSGSSALKSKTSSSSSSALRTVTRPITRSASAASSPTSSPTSSIPTPTTTTTTTSSSSPTSSTVLKPGQSMSNITTRRPFLKKSSGLKTAPSLTSTTSSSTSKAATTKKSSLEKRSSIEERSEYSSRTTTTTTTSSSSSSSSSSSRSTKTIIDDENGLYSSSIQYQSSSSTKLEEFNPDTSPDFEKVVSDFIILDDVVPNYLENLRLQEDDGSGSNDQYHLKSEQIINPPPTSLYNNQLPPQDIVVGDEEEQAEEQVEEVQEQEEIEEISRDQKVIQEEKPIEIKKTTSWMSSFFNKVLPLSGMAAKSATIATTTISKSESLSASSPVSSFEQSSTTTTTVYQSTESTIKPPSPQPYIQPQQPQELKTLPPPPLMNHRHSQQLYNPMYQSSPNLFGHNNHHQYHHHQQQYHHHQHHHQQIRHSQQYSSSPNFNYLMLPHNQPGGLALLPFTIGPGKAVSIFQDWVKSLWFAPADFKEKLEQSLQLDHYFVPYFAFSSIVHSVTSGKVGFLKEQETVVVTSSERRLVQEEIEWMKASTNPYTQTHNDILVYSPIMNGAPNATTSNPLDPPIYENTKEIAEWRLDVSEPFHAQHPQLLHPIVDQQISIYSPNPAAAAAPYQPNPKDPLFLANNENIQSALNGKLVKVIGKDDWETAWTIAERKIKRNESYGKDSKLKRDFKCHSVSDVETETKFENIQYRTVYVPIYKLTYNYNNRDYEYIINGQSGKSHGIRPYGAGSIKNTAIKFLTGGVFSSEKIIGSSGGDDSSNNNMESTALISTNSNAGNNNNSNSTTTIQTGTFVKGADLNQQDIHYNEDEEQVLLYRDDLYYLLFPSSDQFLLYQMVGYIVLKNIGDQDILLESHKRMSDIVGGECILRVGETKTFSYKGSWCIEIKQGLHNCLQVVRIETNSGGDKPSLELSMV